MNSLRAERGLFGRKFRGNVASLDYEIHAMTMKQNNGIR